MPSSIFSFERPLPPQLWLKVFGGACFLFLGLLAGMEWQLAAKGFRATVRDSEELWLQERARASGLGRDALIVIGGSRIQLGLDLDVLRRATGLEPVQLAIDGAHPLPVLEGLARDNSVLGTVVVDYYDHMLDPPTIRSAPARYEAHYERQASQQSSGFDAQRVESRLEERVRQHFRSYANGARPLDSLLMRALSQDATPQYLVTFPDRSRMADYRLVEMPKFYLERVARELNPEERTSLKSRGDEAGLESSLQEDVLNLTQRDNSVFMGRIDYLERLVTQIHERGGRVVFVVMPTSGLVKEIVQRRYPRVLFWDKWAARTSAVTVHFEDYPELRGFVSPDGSHLDYRDRAAFTRALIVAIGIAKP